VLPDRLSYPELIPRLIHGICFYASLEQLLVRLRWALAHRDDARSVAKELRPHVARFDWAEMAPIYDSQLAGVA
jgi:hypothetical protein